MTNIVGGWNIQHEENDVYFDISPSFAQDHMELDCS